MGQGSGIPVGEVLENPSVPEKWGAWTGVPVVFGVSVVPEATWVPRVSGGVPLVAGIPEVFCVPEFHGTPLVSEVPRGVPDWSSWKGLWDP